MNNDYDELPASIKAGMTFDQYQWLTIEEKARLVQDATEPEAFDE